MPTIFCFNVVVGDSTICEVMGLFTIDEAIFKRTMKLGVFVRLTCTGFVPVATQSKIMVVTYSGLNPYTIGVGMVIGVLAFGNNYVFGNNVVLSIYVATYYVVQYGVGVMSFS